MIVGDPHISVIVPTYDRPQQLRECLEAISHSDYPAARFEVVVVDDGSKVAAEASAADFEGAMDIRVMAQQNAGPAAARNTGAQAAEGELLAFTDDDCRPSPTWLRAFADAHAARPRALLGGCTLNSLVENRYSEATQLLIDYLYDYHAARGQQGGFFTSNNMAVPAEGFMRISGFDTTFPLAAGEDREFCDRWLSHGFEMRYTPEAVVYHAHELDLKRFWRQHFNYGRGAFAFHRARVRRGEGRISHEPLRFYLDLLRYPLRREGAGRDYADVLLLLITQIANATGYFFQSAVDRKETPSGEP